jgi:hypothetical protein
VPLASPVLKWAKKSENYDALAEPVAHRLKFSGLFNRLIVVTVGLAPPEKNLTKTLVNGLWVGHTAGTLGRRCFSVVTQRGESDMCSRKYCVIVVTTLAVAIVSSSLVLAAYAAPIKKAASKKAEAVDKKKPDKKAKPRGRLPNYYSEVVSEEQREKIYSLQQKSKKKTSDLSKQIKALQKQIREDRKKLATAIEDVLTDEQKKKVAALKKKPREKRKTKRKKTGTKKDDS